MLFLRRWSRRSKVFAILAVLSGSMAFALVDGYADRLEALRPVTGDPVPVVVAARPLVRGETLSEDAVAVREMPAAFAPPGRIASAAAVAGRTLVSDVAEGEPVTRTRLGVAGGTIATLVPSGLRAFPVTVSIAPDAIRAGDRVDVIATFGGPRPYTDTVASELEVLAILEPDDGAFAAGGG
ncbi:MAG: Flp pilus assembly protein CpaB, partial [Actinomycetota bacterium]